MTDKISPEVQQKIIEFQEFQQQARMIMGQRYQIELQVSDIQMALDELKSQSAGGKEVHKIVGQILIKADPEKIVKELSEKKDMLDIRLKSFKAQEKSVTEKLKAIQDRLQGILPQSSGKGQE